MTWPRLPAIRLSAVLVIAMWMAAAGMTLTVALPVIVLVMELVAVVVWLPAVFRITPVKVYDPASVAVKMWLAGRPAAWASVLLRFTLPTYWFGPLPAMLP